MRAVVLAAFLAGCGAFPIKEAPTLDHAEGECNAEAYFTWGNLQLGFAMQPACDDDGCRVSVCVDAAGFIYCYTVAPESE